MTTHATLSPVLKGRDVTNSRKLTCSDCGHVSTPGPMALHRCDPGYTGIHNRLVRQRGSARKHRCISCGGQARDWAYQHTALDEHREDGFVYSLNLTDYEAMCRKCHLELDGEKNPEGLAARVAAAKAVPSEVRRKAGLASVGTPAGNQQRLNRAIAGGRAIARRWGK